MVKTLNKVSLEGTYLNAIKAIYEKSTGNITLNRENWDFFLPKLRKKTRMSTVTTFFVYFSKVYFIYRDRERSSMSRGTSKWRGRESQVDSSLSMEPNEGSTHDTEITTWAKIRKWKHNGAIQVVLPPLLFTIVWKVLTKAIGQQKEIKDIQISKEEVTFTICRWHDTIYTKPE